MTKSNLIYCLDNIATFIESQIDYLTYVDNIDNKTKDCFTFYASSTEPITLGGEGMEWYVTDMTSHIIMLIEINENKKSTLNLAVKEKALKGAITEDEINVISDYKNVITYNKHILSMTRFTAVHGEEYFNDKFNGVKESVEKYWGSF